MFTKTLATYISTNDPLAVIVPVIAKKRHKRPTCQHGKQRSKCKDCGGKGICQHERRRDQCKDCGGSGICQHRRQRSICKDCGGSQICLHGKQRRQCKDCGGSQICQHERIRRQCKDCVSIDQAQYSTTFINSRFKPVQGTLINLLKTQRVPSFFLMRAN